MALSITGSVAAQLLAQSLVGNGVAISNVTYTGDPSQAGTFTGGLSAGGLDAASNAGIGFDSGIILSTGTASDTANPQTGDLNSTSFNLPGDPALDAATGVPTQDAAILEFDFNPGAASTVYFNFVFGTDEYPASSNYGDPFAVMVNGTEVALLPGDATPLTLAAFNTDGTGSDYKVATAAADLNGNSDGFATQDINAQIESMSVPLRAVAQVLPNQTNHIRFVIADSRDPTIDSFVFLQGGSLATTSLNFAAPPAPTLTICSIVTNAATQSISGTAVPGSTVTLLANGVAVGSAVANATTGIFLVTPAAPLPFGPALLSATATTDAGTSAPSCPVGVFAVPTPLQGISATDASSADLGAVLAQGAQLGFVDGTETVQLTDSTLSVGPDTNEATLQRLYEGLLGRGCDTSGIAYYDAQLAAGADKATVATAFLSSGEYVMGHSVQTDAQFVTSLYQGLLGRTPDPDGLASWTGQLAGGTSRGTVAVGIADSNEAKAHLAPTTARLWVPDAAGTLAHELYKTGLGRDVEQAALPDFKAAFNALTPSQLAANLATSAEFAADHAGQGNAVYVAGLYQAGLGRAADPDGAAFWTGQLDSGAATRGDVLLAIATSGEAHAHLTRDLSVP